MLLQVTCTTNDLFALSALFHVFAPGKHLHLSPSMPLSAPSLSHLCSPPPAPLSCFCPPMLSLRSLLSSLPPLSSIFTPLTLLILFNGVWLLRCCEWVRMAVSRSNPWGLGVIFASVFGQCFSIQSLSQAKIKPLAVTGDKTPCPCATETYCTPLAS